MNVYEIAAYQTSMLGNKPIDWYVYANNCGEAREYLKLYLDSIEFKYNYLGYAYLERKCIFCEENSLFILEPFQKPIKR